MDPFIGQIMLVGFTFAPVNWALCNGQLLQIRQYTALFSLLGTTYGGDGVTTFGLPNLQGNLAVGAGTGIGLPQVNLGQTGGTASVTITTATMAAHSHTHEGNSAAATTGSASGTTFASTGPRGRGFNFYQAAPGANLAQLGSSALTANAGGSQPHSNLQPTLAVNYCIALQGIFPQRP